MSVVDRFEPFNKVASIYYGMYAYFIIFRYWYLMLTYWNSPIIRSNPAFISDPPNMRGSHL